MHVVVHECCQAVGLLSDGGEDHDDCPAHLPAPFGIDSNAPTRLRAGGRVVASPYARKLAREAGVDVADASGTGPDGRIVAADVQQLISSGAHKGTQPRRSFVQALCT